MSDDLNAIIDDLDGRTGGASRGPWRSARV